MGTRGGPEDAPPAITISFAISNEARRRANMAGGSDEGGLATVSEEGCSAGSGMGEMVRSAGTFSGEAAVLLRVVGGLSSLDGEPYSPSTTVSSLAMITGITCPPPTDAVVEVVVVAEPDVDGSRELEGDRECDGEVASEDGPRLRLLPL